MSNDESFSERYWRYATHEMRKGDHRVMVRALRQTHWEPPNQAARDALADFLAGKIPKRKLGKLSSHDVANIRGQLGSIRKKKLLVEGHIKRENEDARHDVIKSKVAEWYQIQLIELCEWADISMKTLQRIDSGEYDKTS